MLNRVLKGQQWEDNARRLDERIMRTGGGAVMWIVEGDVDRYVLSDFSAEELRVVVRH